MTRRVANIAELIENLPGAGSREISLALIDADPQQPRTRFDRARMDVMAASVAAQGVIEPLIVCAHPDKPGRYMLVAGERRWRAAGLAGLARVPAIVRDLNPEQRLAVQLVENIDREELSILDESAAVARLIGFGRKPKEVAQMLGKTPAWVSLRRKIAEHADLLDRFVADGATRDAETLAALVDLHKVDAETFEIMRQAERVSRAAVREAVNAAKRRQASQDEEGEGSDRESGDYDAAYQPDPFVTRQHGASAPTSTEPAQSGRERSNPDSRSMAAGEGAAASDDREIQVRCEQVRDALEVALGFPVSVQEPRFGAPGEVRIAFADLAELENLRQTLT